MEISNKEDVRNYKVSTRKAEVELGVSSKYTPIDSVKDIFDNMDLSKCDLNEVKYYNVRVFKGLHEKFEL